MKSYLLSLLILVLLSPSVFSQFGPLDLQFEFQAYPTGLIPGLRIEKGFGSRNAVHLRLGYNWIRHRDQGEHDDEKGNGYGFTFGYKRYFRESFDGFFIGIRDDTWFNKLDWEDYDATGELTDRGTTKIIVVQPTAEAGYVLPVGEEGKWTFTPTLAFGFEINVKTEGSEVGQGPILLLGFQFGLRKY